MKPTITQEIFDLMESYVTSAALCAAMELGLFWLLKEKPLDTAGVSQELDIPENRCRHWLEILRSLGLLNHSDAGYIPSDTAQRIIIDKYSQDVWAYHGMQDREHFPAVIDITRQMQNPGSTWEVQGMEPPDYIDQMIESPERAAHFTHMLYELHLDMADELSSTLDMRGVHQLMDLGGGSGVMSFALLRNYPHLSAVVVDMENVCAAGREIAAENNLTERVTYHAANFLKDPLPSEFDIVLECDLGIHNEAVFQKIHASLNPGGRYVIVDLFAPAEGLAPPGRLLWEFRDSLDDPDYVTYTIEEILAMLTKVGFEVVSVWELTGGWTVIDAKR
jgi:SAM-dependent methyltransferase